MKNRPTYSIDSVDHALHLATLLQQEGPIRVTEAAERLGVARSTAHRLLGMLVYRDFAEQDEDRRYVAGPVLQRPATPEPVADLRRIALPHLQALADRTDESVNLMIVVGDRVRMIATVEGRQVLRVGDREGRMLPAHLASGGRAVLAGRGENEVAALYADLPASDLTALRRDLRRVRRQGFAVNNQGTETGVTAVGKAVAVPGSGPPAAVSIAIPTARYRRERLVEWVGLLSTMVARIEHDVGGPAPEHGVTGAGRPR